jgi:hypothetical protein
MTKFSCGKNTKNSTSRKKKPECIKFNNKPIKLGKNGANIFCEAFYE